MKKDMDEGLFTLNDAVKRVGPRWFSTLVKPGGAACNLGCRYCYYLGSAGMYGGRQPRMSPDLLELYIKQYIEACEMDQVTFCWHGGEPLLLGLDYFRAAMALQRKYASGKRISNTIQTNGILLDEDWCRFLGENDFLVGLSVDGPADIHDAFRVDRTGRASGGEGGVGGGTHAKVMAGARLLRRNGVKFNTMTVVSRLSEGRGEEIYRFLKEEVGSCYMQFLPAWDLIGDGEDAAVAPWSVSAEGYGRFLCDVFDFWVRRDVGRVFVQIFDSTLARLCGMPSDLCTMAETCGEGLAVEHNGDVYPCDHFVGPEWLLGNIRRNSLAEIFDSPERLRFSLLKRNSLPEECLRCRWFVLCHGGCPAQRLPLRQSGANGGPGGDGGPVPISRRGEGCLRGRNGLCEGMGMFFGHSLAGFLRMRELLRQGRAPAEICLEARANG